MFAFITSSPFVDGADRAILSNDNDFIGRIRAVLPPNPRVVFVCSNPDDHDGTCQFAASTTAAFAEAGIAFSGYQVLDGLTTSRAHSMLTHCDFIVFSGGHVPTQNAFFRRIRLRHQLKGFDGVVMGISAGSMNMANAVYVQPEEEGESSPDFPRWVPGLNLTEVNILPHYQKVKDNILDGQRLFEDITYADSQNNEFFALPDGSYFYQDDGCLLLCGEAYRIRDGVLEQLTDAGDVLDMEELS